MYICKFFRHFQSYLNKRFVFLFHRILNVQKRPYCNHKTSNLSDFQFLERIIKKNDKPIKVVYLRFERISQNKENILLYISKKNRNFAVVFVRICEHAH